jgi:pyruvate dehydrogenase E2 component (dihydrolipoamide acetyltransferase)
LVAAPPPEPDVPEADVEVGAGLALAVRRPASHATPAPDLLTKMTPPPPLSVVKSRSHASPAIRRLGRELGVDLTQVKGSGRHGRILDQDVKGYVKEHVGKAQTQGGGFVLPEAPFVDFGRFGSIEAKPLSRIKKLTAVNLHRAWLRVAHVTQHDEADITDLEAFRKAESEQAKKRNVHLTILPFIMKAVVATLKSFPTFNASLDPQGENLILKHYYHLGIAVDTPDGLVVPVIRDVDHKGVYDLAAELASVSERARAHKLMPGDMQGASFTVSSLGGIGGTAFTPIVNTPEVAILGVSRASMKPVWENGAFVPRLTLPLSLSYDHRVNDGADGARFTTYLRQMLSDIKRLLL